MSVQVTIASAEPSSASPTRTPSRGIQRCSRPRFAVLALAGIAASLYLSACGVGQGAQAVPTANSTESNAQPCKPGGEADKIAIVQDLAAGSSADGGQRLDLSSLDALVEAMRCNGGELAVSFVDGRDVPLARLTVNRLPAEPSRPSSDSNVVRARAAADQYTQDHAAWEAKVAAWEQRTAGALVDFKARLQAPIGATPASDPDIWAVLRRVEAFFDESRTDGTRASHPYVLLISERERFTTNCKDITGERKIKPGMTFTDDQTGITWVCTGDGEWKNAASAGQGNASGDPPNVALPLLDPRIRIVVAKGGPGPGPLDELNPSKFEQPGPALQSIESQLKQAQ